MTNERTPLRSECAKRVYFDGIALIAGEVFDVLDAVYRDYFKNTEMYFRTLEAICRYEMLGEYETAIEFISALSILVRQMDATPYIKIYAFSCLNEEGLMRNQLLESEESTEASQRANGFLTLAGGLIITFTKEILTLITG